MDLRIFPNPTHKFEVGIPLEKFLLWFGYDSRYDFLSRCLAIASATLLCPKVCPQAAQQGIRTLTLISSHEIPAFLVDQSRGQRFWNSRNFKEDDFTPVLIQQGPLLVVYKKGRSFLAETMGRWELQVVKSGMQQSVMSEKNVQLHLRLVRCFLVVVWGF